MKQLDEGWTIERVDLLHKLWGEGWSAAKIAEQIPGMSRSAVLGKARRLKLDVRTTPRERTSDIVVVDRIVARARARADRQRGPIVARKRAPTRQPGRDLEATEATDIAPDDAIPLHQRKTLAQLTNRCCRWPCGNPGSPDFFFCGKPDADMEKARPYCAVHDRRAHTLTPPPPPRKPPGESGRKQFVDLGR